MWQYPKWQLAHSTRLKKDLLLQLVEALLYYKNNNPESTILVDFIREITFIFQTILSKTTPKMKNLSSVNEPRHDFTGTFAEAKKELGNSLIGRRITILDGKWANSVGTFHSYSGTVNWVHLDRIKATNPRGIGIKQKHLRNITVDCYSLHFIDICSPTWCVIQHNVSTQPLSPSSK